MQYRINPKNGDSLSALGYGCMRFSRRAGGLSIKQEKAIQELKLAYEQGINYFDTAYLYPGSEVTLGKFLADGYRDKVYVATKLPHHLCKKHEDFDRLFNEQKKRLQTTYIDYYLIHMLPDITTWNKLLDLGILEWIEEKKKEKEIRNIGFSYHGGTDGFNRLIDVYDWDFCQIQLNYLDSDTQAGTAGLKYAASKGIPVIIMEPLQGGRLCNPPKNVERIFKQSDKTKTSTEWALRWLWNFPEITTVLSGMNSEDQINQNCKYAEIVLPNSLSSEELNTFEEIKEMMKEDMRVPCTACNYCMPCPHGVDIPSCFASYNKRLTLGWFQGMLSYVTCTSLKEKSAAASACVNCGLCEKKCPQHILIRDYLDETKHVMEGPIYRISLKIIKKIAGIKK